VNIVNYSIKDHLDPRLKSKDRFENT